MVGTGVNILATIVGAQVFGLLMRVVAINRAEITSVETNLLVNVPGTTETDRVAVASKRGVLLISVGEAVVGTLTATADGELVVNVVLNTCQYLMGAVL